MTYRETLAHIYSRRRFGMKPGLERVSALLASLGHPERRVSAVHVAGTNGKGSTAAFLAAILREGGYRIGLFTSPHLVDFTERVRIDGVPISPEAVIPLAERVLAAAGPETTFFEIVTALALLHFAEAGVDLAILEAGMGGGSDATAAANGLLTVLTPIALDHCDYLGESTAAIAAEKARIAKPGTPVVTARQDDGAMAAIEERCAAIAAPLYRFGRDFDAGMAEGHFHYRGIASSLDRVRPALAGPHQGENAACAVAAAELLGGVGWPVDAAALSRGIESASWPGRLELFPGPPPILLDGAHNPAGAAALARALEAYPRRRLHLVVGVVGDKDAAGILAPLLPLADCVYPVAPPVERALSASALFSLCRRTGCDCRETGDLGEGLAAARAAAAPDDLILVCGSLFTVGAVRAILIDREFEPCRG